MTVSAQFSQYGAYLYAMFQKIKISWDKERMGKRDPGAGKSTSVTYVLASSGQVLRIKKVSGDAGNVSEEACITAIKSSAPYGVWSADMRATLGDEQEITLPFYY